MEISRVGIGTAPIGSTPEWRVYWGPQDEDEAIRAIRTALDLGVNWIDTAPFYGWGRAERIVGKAIRGRRDEVFIFTKCGTLPDGKGGWFTSLRPDSIRRELEASLRNLETEYVDLYQFHDPDPATPIEESWSEMHRLVREGKVRYGGLSNHPVDLIGKAMKVGPVISNQVQYNPLERNVEREVLPFCLRSGVGVLGWGSLAEGFLSDDFDHDALDPKDFRRRHRFGQPENVAKITKLRQAFGRIATSLGKKIVHIVIAWELMNPALTGAIVGIRSEREAREMIGGVGVSLSHEDMHVIEAALRIWGH